MAPLSQNQQYATPILIGGSGSTALIEGQKVNDSFLESVVPEHRVYIIDLAAIVFLP
jgi:hypothetical protein